MGVAISEGTETVIVPNVVGLSQETAETTLANNGLTPDVVSTPAEEPEGQVIAQSPKEGAEANEGDVVQITVSEGPEEREMPDVSGQDADEAEALLESDQYGLVVTQEAATEACTEPPGNVCDQDPAPGEPVIEGDSATLFVQPGGAMRDTSPLWALLVRSAGIA